MRIPVFAVRSAFAVASGAVFLMLAAAAGQAHEMASDASRPDSPPANCPPPKAPPRPVHRHHARPACPIERHAAAHRRHGHALVLRQERRPGPDDVGVAPSQAMVYRRELERDRRLAHMAPPPRSIGPAPPRLAQRAPPPCPPPAAGLETRRVVIERREQHPWSHGEHGGYLLAGRDLFGYLVWPGKTP